MMNASKILLFVGLSILLISSCSTNKKLNGIWVSEDNKSILEISDGSWIIIYSEISGLCTKMRLSEDFGDSGTLELISPQGMGVKNPTIYHIKENELKLLGYRYSKESLPKWDSILVYNDANPNKNMELTNHYTYDSSMLHDLLVAIIMVPQFNLIRPSNTGSDYEVKYELWHDNKIIGSKIGGSNYLCVSQ